MDEDLFRPGQPDNIGRCNLHNSGEIIMSIVKEKINEHLTEAFLTCNINLNDFWVSVLSRVRIIKYKVIGI